jgi:hypothetical protein
MKKSATFVKSTNWQSRTAMVIMPALFSFAWTAERHLDHKMAEIAQESQHNRDTVQWADEYHRQSQQQRGVLDTEIHLMDLYRRSIDQSGVNVVPGDQLGVHHRFANYVLANPIKVVAGLAVPSVALIFYGNSTKGHLQASTKMLHTRVFGQFTTLSLMLGIGFFHSYMASHGKYITEVDANRRVAEMAAIRQALSDRLDYEAEKREQQQQEIATAHDQVVHDRQAKKKAAKVQALSLDAAPSMTATSPK